MGRNSLVLDQNRKNPGAKTALGETFIGNDCRLLAGQPPLKPTANSRWRKQFFLMAFLIFRDIHGKIFFASSKRNANCIDISSFEANS